MRWHDSIKVEVEPRIMKGRLYSVGDDMERSDFGRRSGIK